MAKYKLTNKAVEDLAEIWEYTFEEWSEQQADNYYEMLISNCKEIASNLCLSQKTIANYATQIKLKLGVKTLAEMSHLAQSDTE